MSVFYKVFIFEVLRKKLSWNLYFNTDLKKLTNNLLSFLLLLSFLFQDPVFVYVSMQQIVQFNSNAIAVPDEGDFQLLFLSHPQHVRLV